MAEDLPPLFIPLRTQWFLEFKAGTKNVEYRAYGKRWNERACQIGRKVVLSHGYGNKERLQRTVSGFEKVHHDIAPGLARVIFPQAEFIAVIHLSE